MIDNILHSCSCVIDFIKLVSKKAMNFQQAYYLILLHQLV